MTDNVDKPNHYTFGKFECIDVIEELSKQNNLQGAEGFLYGNILKYLWRYKHKNGIEDLQKARWYLDRLISNTENDFKPVEDNNEDNKLIKCERKLSKRDLRVMRELETALKMINDFQTNCLLMSIQKQIALILGMGATSFLLNQIVDTYKSLAKANSELSMLKSELESELKIYYGEK